MIDVLGVIASGYRPDQGPPPGPTYAVFANPSSNGDIHGGGVLFRHSGGAGAVANCLTSAPITGKVYFEVAATLAAAAETALAMYGGAQTTLPNTIDLGSWENEPGVLYGRVPNIWEYVYANYGLAHDTYINTATNVPTLPTTYKFGAAVDASTRQVWLRKDGGAWVSGGNPAAGTGETFILDGSSQIYGGATSGDPTNVIELLHPDDYAAAAPSGFTPGILVPP